METYDKKTQRAALISAGLSSFLTPFMASSINITIPIIGKEFSLDAVTLSWVASAYLLSSAMFLVPFGKIADIWGRKKVFLAGLYIYTFAAILCGFALNGPMLIGLRILQGVGGAMIFGTGVAIITSVIPPQERGKAIGINIAIVYAGLSLGPFVGGLLTHYLGWRSVFYANIPMGLIAIYFCSTRLKGEFGGDRNDKLDYIGSIIYGISLVGIMYGLSKLPATYGYLFLAAGIAGIVAFVLRQMKIDYPVMNINLFRGNTIFAFSNIAALINYSATSAVTFLLSLYLQDIKLMSPQAAGSVLVIQPIVMTIASPIAGRLSDKVESRIIASLGMGFTVVGLVMLAFLTESTGMVFLVASLMLLGLGFGLFSSPNTNAAMSAINKKYYGVGSATISTMRLVGQMLSMGIASLVLSVIVGKVQIRPEYHAPLMTSIKIIFTIFIVLCSLGIFASLARGRQHNY